MKLTGFLVSAQLLGILVSRSHAVRMGPQGTAKISVDGQKAKHEAMEPYDQNYEYGHDNYYGYLDDDYGMYGGNITEKVTELFPQMDVNKDNKVSFKEIEEFHYKRGANLTKMRTEREFEQTDTDENGLITLKEFLGEEHNTLVEVEKGTADDVKERYEIDWVVQTNKTFRMSDQDGDGALNQAEFFTFLHPEESNNTALKMETLNQYIKDRDDNADNKLDATEFHQNLWFELKDPSGGADELDNPDLTADAYEAEEDADDRPEADKKFKELDKNQDGFLDAAELKEVESTLNPNERDYAKMQAEHMLNVADEDTDKHLSIAEMLSNPWLFYQAINDGDNYYDDSYHEFH